LQKISKEEGKRTRIIGWYHSHPHFNPYPSHVDLRCQGNYQQLEKGFVGLIFSVFNTTSDQQSTIQLHAFQSRPKENAYHEVENLASPISSSDDEFEQFASLSPVRSTPFETINIPVTIIPSSQVNYEGKSIERIISLQQIMLEEEKNGFTQAQEILEEMKGQAASLNRISNLSLYQRNLARIIDQCSLPLLTNLQEELEYNTMALKALKQEEEKLLKEMGAFSL
jgi:hypothetical protein